MPGNTWEEGDIFTFPEPQEPEMSDAARRVLERRKYLRQKYAYLSAIPREMELAKESDADYQASAKPDTHADYPASGYEADSPVTFSKAAATGANLIARQLRTGAEDEIISLGGVATHFAGKDDVHEVDTGYELSTGNGNYDEYEFRDEEDEDDEDTGEPHDAERIDDYDRVTRIWLPDKEKQKLIEEAREYAEDGEDWAYHPGENMWIFIGQRAAKQEDDEEISEEFYFS